MSVAGALLGSSLIGAGASLFGASKAEKAQKEAAKVQAAQYQEGKNLLMPYTAGTTEAQTMYGNAIGANGKDAQTKYYEDFQADPGFQTSLNTALDSTMKRYSIIGRTGGSMSNALLKTGQGALNSAYNTRISQLGAFADSGKAAATSIANIGTTSANNVAGNLAAAGQYQGAGIANAGNALMTGLQNYAGLDAWKSGVQSGYSPTVNRAML